MTGYSKFLGKLGYESLNLSIENLEGRLFDWGLLTIVLKISLSVSQ